MTATGFTFWNLAVAADGAGAERTRFLRDVGFVPSAGRHDCRLHPLCRRRDGHDCRQPCHALRVALHALWLGSLVDIRDRPMWRRPRLGRDPARKGGKIEVKPTDRQNPCATTSLPSARAIRGRGAYPITSRR